MAMASWLYWLLVIGELAKAMTLVLFSSKGSIKGAIWANKGWGLLVVSYYDLIDDRAMLLGVRVDISFGLNDRDVVILIELFNKLGCWV